MGKKGKKDKGLPPPGLKLSASEENLDLTLQIETLERTLSCGRAGFLFGPFFPRTELVGSVFSFPANFSLKTSNVIASYLVAGQSRRPTGLSTPTGRGCYGSFFGNDGVWTKANWSRIDRRRYGHVLPKGTAGENADGGEVQVL